MEEAKLYSYGLPLGRIHVVSYVMEIKGLPVWQVLETKQTDTLGHIQNTKL